MVSPATRGPAERTLALPASISAYEDSPVYARVNGYVSKWTVDIGTRVKAGQLLVEIETPELHQQLKQAEALVLQAKANAEIAQITYRRYVGLVKTNAVSQQDVDNSQAALEARKADVVAAEAEVGRLTAMVAFQKIYALPMIRDGLAVEVTVREYPERSFGGRVVRNAASLDKTSRTMEVEIQTPNPDGILLPGLYATAHFKLVDPTPPIVVADSSVIVLADGPQIAIVDKDDIVRIRKIRLGRDAGKTIEIVSGVTEGDRVVQNPSDLLKDGIKVRVLTDSAARQ